MLEGYEHAYEKESTLTFILSKCIEKGKFQSVEAKVDHSDMVTDGLLEDAGKQKYKLTNKSIGLLFSYYGKELK